MSTEGLNYQANTKVLCPYYVKENKYRIMCTDGIIAFESQEAKKEWRSHHCFKAIPMNCETYQKHLAAIKRGEEERIKPRGSVDDSRRLYKRNWGREHSRRRKEKKE